jgi:hypothetical protein
MKMQELHPLTKPQVMKMQELHPLTKPQVMRMMVEAEMVMAAEMEEMRVSRPLPNSNLRILPIAFPGILID